MDKGYEKERFTCLSIKVSIASIRDGTSNTIAFGEWRTGDGDVNMLSIQDLVRIGTSPPGVNIWWNQMTQMPELVAILHSLVGLAAVLVGFATFLDAEGHQYQGAEKTIHDVEIYLGVLIGAVTFSGSVIAFLKLSARIGGRPLTLPARGLGARDARAGWRAHGCVP